MVVLLLSTNAAHTSVLISITVELYCEKQYETYDDRCYIYYTKQLAWADALQYCVDNDNGNLASAKNETQQEFLSNISSIYTGD